LLPFGFAFFEDYHGSGSHSDVMQDLQLNSSQSVQVVAFIKSLICISKNVRWVLGEYKDLILSLFVLCNLENNEVLSQLDIIHLEVIVFKVLDTH
jgi:hypothetical protein